MKRIIFGTCLWGCAATLLAHPEPLPPERLAPPVERVLSQLSLDDARRAQVREVLLRQRQERQQANAAMRERHRAELAVLLTQDQLAALEAAQPPPRMRPPQPPQPQPPQ